jgi:hypothetical protein
MTVSADEARTIALALPEVVEADHHGRPSFRVRGKIFATLWDHDRMNVMLDEDGVRPPFTALRKRAQRCGGASGSPRSP